MNKHERAKKLRRDLTQAEKKLWLLLRNRQLSGFKFRRQHPVGPYCLDFACTEHALAIEIDGGQHNENVNDVKRTAYLQTEGWQIMRFWNNEVLGNVEGVYETILSRLAEYGATSHPHPHPTAVPAVDLSRSAGEVSAQRLLNFETDPHP